MWLMRSRDQIRRQFQILDRLQFEIWKSRRLDSMITWLNLGHVADAVTWPWSAPISSSRTFSIFLRFQSTETGANFRPFEFNCYRSVRSRDQNWRQFVFDLLLLFFFYYYFFQWVENRNPTEKGRGKKLGNSNLIGRFDVRVFVIDLSTKRERERRSNNRNISK